MGNSHDIDITLAELYGKGKVVPAL